MRVSEETMTFLSHLSELRSRIWRILAVFLASMGGGLYLSPKVLRYLKSVPPGSEMTWNVFSPWDGIRMYMTIAVVISLTVSLPFILYQLWGFVKMGLHPEERSAALRYVPYSVICFLTGLAFGYFVVFPMSFAFTSKITHSMHLVETYGVAQYFGFMCNIVIPLAAAFELPVVVMFLTKIGVLTPKGLRKMRRYAYLVLVVVASLISPPELISHLMVFIPLVLLYEISVLLSRAVYGRKKSAALADAA
ncbi:twin-arginine translocase subunit TatC [Paenibacillus sacheonensis]|uniref:Sec-independent protein translocase protein TatC n=1 Tax=Paenibacillus sacheonensis TaxID=742054 RepID=A0A7X4YU65_9BACL|nr:twin-arginine translocase subunit TatC [Paenibacillus sacheonensis]MBM7568909.1 sec-independent protein translocase protein TatC [Paenibacillus sacheonensis]NBC72610.1 twin-arginine translocase subunit TatC [Paenibacillus sacheonensis]